MERIQPGQEFDVERADRGNYRLVRRTAPLNEGAMIEAATAKLGRRRLRNSVSVEGDFFLESKLECVVLSEYL